MCRLLILSVILITICSSAIAQSKQANTAAVDPAAVPKEKTERELEAERVLNERRSNVRSLLINVAAEARNFPDARVRARTQARIADALWDVDPQRSRALFRAAWDAADVADVESYERVQKDIREQQARNKNGGYSISPPLDIRHEVLQLAAKRDPKLAEELLASYQEQKARDAAANRSRDVRGMDQGTIERFAVAKDALTAGDIERALQYADPGLTSVNMESIDFLSVLREKNQIAAADQRYAAMLMNAAADAQADANTVALLSSYIFTPHLYVVFHSAGSMSSQYSGQGQSVPIASPELRALFFRSALPILLRPLPEGSTAGLDGQYLAIRRMLPLFQQFGPPQGAAALTAQLESLAAAASDQAHQFDGDFMHRGIEPEKPATAAAPTAPPTPPVDREQALLDQVDHAKTPAERDQTNMFLALLMVDKDDKRARSFVDKIDDSELRNSVRAYIDAAVVWKVMERRESNAVRESERIDRLLELVKTGQLTHLQKAYVLAQTAAALRKDHDRALTVIDNAAEEARRLDNSDPDRARAFFAIANVMWNLNRPAVWDVLGEAVRAANGAEMFTGEEGKISFHIAGKASLAGHQHAISDFDVAGIFSRLSVDDYEKSVEMARGFQNGAPRANAVIAIAHTVLSQK